MFFLLALFSALLPDRTLKCNQQCEKRSFYHLTSSHLKEKSNEHLYLQSLALEIVCNTCKRIIQKDLIIKNYFLDLAFLNDCVAFS
jgi:hypothetical protein